MIWPHVAAKTLKEVVRQPITAVTVLGLPLVMMVVFGAALPRHGLDPFTSTPSPAAGKAAPGGAALTKANLTSSNATTTPAPALTIPARSSSSTTTGAPPVSSPTTPWWWQSTARPARGR